MKKCTFLLLALCLLTVQLDAQVAIATARELSIVSKNVQRAMAQGAKRSAPTIGRTGLTATQVSRVLGRRALRTGIKASKTAIRIPQENNARFHPTLQLSPFTLRQVEPLITAAPYLTDPALLSAKELKPVEHYLVAQENRLYLQEIERLQNEVWPRLNALLPRLEEQAATFPQPADPLSFIVEQIPSTVHTLFIGETHLPVPVTTTVADLLTHLREKHPNQKIILFSEFLPQNFKWEGKIPDWYTQEFEKDNFIPGFSQRHIAMYERLRPLGVEIVGLEPMPANIIPFPEFIFGKDKTNIWASLTGVKYRNEQFMEVINQARKENPDAFFVVYTGAGHSGYRRPFSLATHFKPEEIFVVRAESSGSRYLLSEEFIKELVGPEVLQKVKEQGRQEEHFDTLEQFIEQAREELGELDGLRDISYSSQKFLLPEFLYLSDKELARGAAGFDAYFYTHK